MFLRNTVQGARDYYQSQANLPETQKFGNILTDYFAYKEDCYSKSGARFPHNIFIG